MNPQLSSGYEKVEVKIRGEDTPIVLGGDSGESLMTYLIEKPGQFIKLTDQNGDVVVVRTTTIDKIIPHKPRKSDKELAAEALQRWKEKELQNDKQR